MLSGYAHVSTQNQYLDLQHEVMTMVGGKKILKGRARGTSADLPSLAKTLEILRESDTLVVWKLDRLDRSVKQLVDS